jgi:hypothetical protein
MADTDRPDLDTWEEIALESERHYGHPGCIECDCGPAPLREVISYARSLESQLAESQRENEAMRDWFKRWDTEVPM